jgi:hypothetical protein
MKNIVGSVLAVFFLLGVCAAQGVPVNIFGGYSYYNFDLPGNPSDGQSSQRLAMNGFDASVSAFSWHHMMAEADVSGHTLSNCDSTNFSCSNISFMGGARYRFMNGEKINAFFRGLAGVDHATIAYNGSSLTDSTLAADAGVGVQYWAFRRIGFQAGGDYVFTRHLNDFDIPIQNNFRANVGVVFRFGSGVPGYQPPAPKATRASGQVAVQPSQGGPVRGAAAPPSTMTAHGMAIAALGAVVAPQEFDGAKVVEVDPGGTAEMASIKAGDLITTVDGQPVRTPMELLAALSEKTGKVKIGIQRGDFKAETLILVGTH